MLTGLVIACALAWCAIVVLAARVEHQNAVATNRARATLAAYEADKLERQMTTPNTVRLASVADHPANAHRRRQYRDAR